MVMQDLIDKRAKAWAAAKAFLDSRRNEDGVLSAEDDATYDKMEKDITDLTKEIERLQRQEQIDRMMDQPVNAPITMKPGKTGEVDEKTGLSA